MNTSITDFIAYCAHQHNDVCNQRYDGKFPYSIHLEYVSMNFKRFQNLLPDDAMIRQKVHIACWGHDLIEDARVSYNDIKAMTDEEVAEVVFLCTETRGRNRKERHSEEFYTGLGGNFFASFVKMCDILANVKYSILTHSRMLSVYREEHYASKHLWVDKFPRLEPMVKELETLLELSLYNPKQATND